MAEQVLHSNTYVPIHARVRESSLEIDQLPGCCSASVINGFFDKAIKGSVSPDALAKAEEFADRNKQNCLLATISENQKNDLGSGQLLTQAGWTLVHTFPSRPYGGGKVYVYAKNLVEKAR